MQKRISTVLAVLIPILALAALVTILIVFTASDSSGTSAENSAEAIEDSSGIETNTNNSDAGASPYSTAASLTVKNGDTVNIDYVRTVDGAEFDGGNIYGVGTDLTIGSGLYIDDFEEQLIGAHPGDTVEVKVTFPEDFGNEELNGKDAVFEVVINEIYK